MTKTCEVKHSQINHSDQPEMFRVTDVHRGWTRTECLAHAQISEERYARQIEIIRH